jgi:competence protein ComEC
LGIWRADFKLEKIDEVEEFQEKIEFVSKVLKEPREKDWYKNVVLEIEEGKRVLVRVDLFDNIKYGDKLKVSCLPEIPENFSDDFDYRMYLAKDNIFYICKEAQIEKVQDEKKGFYSVILNIKNNMESNLEKVIPAPEVELAKGLLFGGDDGLSKDLQEDFSRTGMTHIVAVSGYNVTIIAEYLMVFGIFFGLWRKQSFYFALLGIFIFVAMIGFPSSAIRAGLMGSLLLWAMKNGRLANIENAILLSGAIMLLINPLSLRWDIGFQLSFLATLGIVKMAPIWEKYFLGKFKAFGLMEIVLMTIGAQIFVLPIIFCNFHTFSAVSVLANLLILLIIPLTMLFAFLSALSGFVFYPLSLAFGWAAYGFLHYEIVVVKSLADLKWASVDINNFGIFGFLIWYLTIFVFIYFISRKEKKRYNKVV